MRDFASAVAYSRDGDGRRLTVSAERSVLTGVASVSRELKAGASGVR